MVLDGALYRAPIPEGVGRILDLGTGTGAWAIDMAEYGYSNQPQDDALQTLQILMTKQIRLCSQMPQAVVTGPSKSMYLQASEQGTNVILRNGSQRNSTVLVGKTQMGRDVPAKSAKIIITF